MGERYQRTAHLIFHSRSVVKLEENKSGSLFRPKVVDGATNRDMQIRRYISRL